ncbi:MAG: low molecular weight protein-tyrosine-phosphatase [Cytophagaceae bacterium]
MVKVLFVCLGNICRSPLAEGIFKHKIKQRKLTDFIFCDSAGTGAYHIGKNPDIRSCNIALKYMIALDHKARQLTVKDFAAFDYILAMDAANMNHIKSFISPSVESGKIFMMNHFDDNKSGVDVPDPYYGGLDGFEHVYRMLEISCGNLLNHIIDEHNLK